MAFGVKYRCEFSDHFNNAIKIDILNKDYGGAVTSVTGGATPVVIRWLGEGDDKYKPIKGSEAIISIVSSTDEQYVNIFTGKNKEWQVKIYKATVLQWQGWIDNNEYSEPFLFIPYEIQLHAYCGLGELKNIEYINDGEPFLTSVSAPYDKLILHFARALSLIDFDLDIWVGVNLSHIYQGGGKLFETTYIDYRVWKENSKTWDNAYNVLQFMLKAFHCRIFQRLGRWYIERVDYKSETPQTYYVYTSAGSLKSTEAVTPRVALTNSTGSPLCVWEGQSQVLEIDPAFKEFRLVQDPEERETILGHSDFTGIFNDQDFDTTVPIQFNMVHWTKFGGISAIHTLGEEGFLFSPIPTVNWTTQYVVSDSVTLENELVDQNKLFPGGGPEFKLIVSVEVKSADGLGFQVAEGLTGWVVMELKWVFTNAAISTGGGTFAAGITNGGDTITLYLDNDGNFHTIVATFGQLFEGDDQLTSIPPGRDYITIEQATNEFTIDPAYTGVNTVTVKYFGFFNGSVTGDSYVKSIKVKLTSPELENDNVSNKNSQLTTVDSAYREVPSDFEFKFADRNDLNGNHEFFNRYNLLVKDGTDFFAIDNWFAEITPPAPSGGTPLINHIARDFVNAQHKIPRRRFRGTLLTDDIDFQTVLVDADSRPYMCNGVEWNLKMASWRGEWVELWELVEVPVPPGDFNDDFSEDFLL